MPVWRLPAEFLWKIVSIVGLSRGFCASAGSGIFANVSATLQFLIDGAIRTRRSRRTGTIVGEHQGRIVKETGDGFFAAFDDVSDGVNCTIAIQRALDDHRRTDGFAPSVRIGLHVGTTVTIDADFAGRDVVVAARIGSLAGAEQILVAARWSTRWDQAYHPRADAPSLKGIPEPVEVATLNWR